MMSYCLFFNWCRSLCHSVHVAIFLWGTVNLHLLVSWTKSYQMIVTGSTHTCGAAPRAGAASWPASPSTWTPSSWQPSNRWRSFWDLVLKLVATLSSSILRSISLGWLILATNWWAKLKFAVSQNHVVHRFTSASLDIRLFICLENLFIFSVPSISKLCDKWRLFKTRENCPVYQQLEFGIQTSQPEEW